MGRNEALVGSHESNTFAGALVAETEEHLQHEVMFMDGERRVLCLCGWSCSYGSPEFSAFQSYERGPRKDVFDAMSKLPV